MRRIPTAPRSRLETWLAAVFAAVALATAVVIRIVHPGPRRVPLHPVDVVVVILLVAAALVTRASPRRRRVGLWLGATALALLQALSTHPLEGPVLFMFPGGLGLGVHPVDLVVTAMLAVGTWWLERQVGWTASAVNDGDR